MLKTYTVRVRRLSWGASNSVDCLLHPGLLVAYFVGIFVDNVHHVRTGQLLPSITIKNELGPTLVVWLLDLNATRNIPSEFL